MKRGDDLLVCRLFVFDLFVVYLSLTFCRGAKELSTP